MFKRSLVALFSLLFLLQSEAAAIPEDCKDISKRIFCVTGGCVVLGDKWIWSDRNILLSKDDVSSKEKLISAIKEEDKKTLMREGFDVAFEKKDPMLLSNLYIAFMGARMTVDRETLGYKKPTWFYLGKEYACGAYPLRCHKKENPKKDLTRAELKVAFSSFLELKKLERVDEFCADIQKGADKVYLKYKERVARCSPNWKSMEDYCLSVSNLFNDVSAQLQAL